MATRTVNQGFADFLRTLTPTSGESTAAISHRASIETCLKNNFSINSFFRTGSFGNGTSISGYSDVDYFADIPARRLNSNSTTSLTKVRNALATRFPNTRVRVNCPAVVVPFGTDAKETTEIIPAFYVKKKDGYRVFGIPDCSDGWMSSSPEAHNAYVRKIDQKLNGRLKPLIRFIKAWNFYQNVRISSFYLELRVTKYAEGKSRIVYELDLKRVFSHLDSVELRDIRDPMGISGNISACSTQTILQSAKTKLFTAAIRAQKAYDAIINGNIRIAFEWWRKLYNGNFPSYYY